MEAARTQARDDLARILAFSDGVLAIAITLLVLNIGVPELAGSAVDRLSHEILETWPDLVAYALSFAVIGRFWWVHHRLFEALGRIDGRLVALNLLFLAFVVLMPFSTELVGRYGDRWPATVAYAANAAAASVAIWLLHRYALHAGVVLEERRRQTERLAAPTALLWPAVFLASMPVAVFWTPAAAYATWTLGAFLRPRSVRY